MHLLRVVGPPTQRERAAQPNHERTAGLGKDPDEGHAFLWTAGTGMVDLNAFPPTLAIDLNGWTLVEAHAISANGRTIAGYGLDEVGLSEAWVARLPQSNLAWVVDAADRSTFLTGRFVSAKLSNDE